MQNRVFHSDSLWSARVLADVMKYWYVIQYIPVCFDPVDTPSETGTVHIPSVQQGADFYYFII